MQPERCDALPATQYWEAEHLAKIKASPDSRSHQVSESLNQLKRAAEIALRRGPYSVVDKDILPPSGDKHDYLSYSRYWWPNPDTENGLPYVRRDGEVNHPLLERGDRRRIGQLYDDVEALALAAYFHEDLRYAEHAVLLLRTWFLDPETRMAPNLNYGQGVPGVSHGRRSGVIDTRHFLRVIDSIHLLRSIDALTEQDYLAIQNWFEEFLDWLLESDLGRGEREAENNHGVWYAAQAAGIALFVERPELAKALIEETRDDRIPQGIEPDGSQPEELKRTQSLHYSLFSLSAYAMVARYGEHVDVDLWNHSTDDGRSIKRALDYAAPFIARQEQWRHPMISKYAISDRQAQLFYLCATRLRDPSYSEYAEVPQRRSNELILTPLLFRTE